VVFGFLEDKELQVLLDLVDKAEKEAVVVVAKAVLFVLMALVQVVAAEVEEAKEGFLELVVLAEVHHLAYIFL